MIVKHSTNDLLEQLAKLRNDYLATLPTELKNLQKLAAGLSGGEHERASLEALHHRLHKLSGSGGTFGLPELSNIARVQENKIKAWLSGSLYDVDVKELCELAKGVSSLVDTVEDVKWPVLSASISSSGPAVGHTLTVWLVEDDSLLGQQLQRQLESFNYEVELFSNIDEAEKAAETSQPHMLIMDVLFSEAGENATEVLWKRPFLSKLACPLLFISASDDFNSRVRAVRLGADAYILKPLDIPRLVNRMDQIFVQRRALPQRVLIVDDDSNLVEHHRLVLMNAGMRVEVLPQLDTIIETLSAFQPELILMDMHMPEYSGSELAGVIRQYDKWDSLPIVYLSSETDLDQQVQAMKRGADDFLTKPISPEQLVAAVHVRIERARHLEGQISKDSLTGLLKHANIKEAVEAEVMRAQRSGKAVTVAMLDIDHFKAVNDSYGHAVGDVVISSLATLLRQRLRQSDIVGRYGGEEFIAVLPDCDNQIAFQLLDDLRLRFADIRFSHNLIEFSCSLSVGLACSDQYPISNGEGYLIAADEALYAAKRGGRNQVQLSSVTLKNGKR